MQETENLERLLERLLDCLLDRLLDARLLFHTSSTNSKTSQLHTPNYKSKPQPLTHYPNSQTLTHKLTTLTHKLTSSAAHNTQNTENNVDNSTTRVHTTKTEHTQKMRGMSEKKEK